MKNLRSDKWQIFWPHILQIAHIGVWEMNFTAEGVSINFGEPVRLLFGYEEDDIAGKWETFLHNACHPDFQSELQKIITHAASTPDFNFHYEFKIWNKRTATWHWVYLFGKSQQTQGGMLLLGGVQDIHERRASQKKLEREQLEALQTIALQKAVLEQQVEERTTLLRDVQNRVDTILGASAPENMPGTSVPLPPMDVYDEVDILYAEGLHKAFDDITNKMAWYKAVIDSIPFPISVTDMDNQWMYLNKPGLAAAGAKSLAELFGHPATAWSTQGEALSEQGGQARFRLHHALLCRFFQGQASALVDSKGGTIGHIETMQDVTKVHEADERTRLMLDAMPYACSFWNQNLNAIDCNEAVVSLFDLPDKDAFFSNFKDLSPPKQPCGRSSDELANEKIRLAFESGRQRFEWVHKKSSGELIPVEVTLVRINWRGSYLVVGYVTDLRELKTAREELDKERLLLKEVLDSSPVCMLIQVRDTIRFVTPFTREFLGVNVGDSMYEFYVSKPEAHKLEEELAHNRVLNWRPVALKSAKGDTREMLANAFYTEYYGEEGTIFWLVDVTDMHEKERQLLLARDAAEESTKAKSEFLANMSHEIRTPLNAVLGMAHLVLRTDLTPKQRSYLEKIEYSGKALLRIINDILDFSKIEAGKLEMERVPFAVENVMRDVIAIINQSAREKGIEIFLSVPPDMPNKVEGDPLRLHQVLLNLASNSVKFTGNGSVSLGVTILDASKDKLTLDFSVADTGIGLTQAQISKLFSPFTQADTSTTREYGGTGLGLAICKRLVELMHGSIWCESGPGQGATFRFTANFGTVETAPTYSAANFSKLEVLLLGDNIPALSMMRPMMQGMGCIVATAFSLEQGVTLLQRPTGFDVIIMDWRNPQSDAPKTVAVLYEQTGKKLPPTLLALPATVENTTVTPKNFNVTEIIIKPATPSNIFNGIHTVLYGFGKATPSTKEGGPPDSEPQNDAETARLALASVTGKHVLLVEDNLINQMVARELLEIAGLTVDTAVNGQEALDKIGQNTYDLLLMDIQMPVMDGFTAATTIRSDKKFAGLPIIAMTALAMQGDKEKSLAAGMNGHVTKPIDAADLYNTLIQWLL